MELLLSPFSLPRKFKVLSFLFHFIGDGMPQKTSAKSSVPPVCTIQKQRHIAKEGFDTYAENARMISHSPGYIFSWLYFSNAQ